jgi:hypothetical protein
MVTAEMGTAAMAAAMRIGVAVTVQESVPGREAATATMVTGETAEDAMVVPTGIADAPVPPTVTVMMAAVAMGAAMPIAAATGNAATVLTAAVVAMRTAGVVAVPALTTAPPATAWPAMAAEAGLPASAAGEAPISTATDRYESRATVATATDLPPAPTAATAPTVAPPIAGPLFTPASRR